MKPLQFVRDSPIRYKLLLSYSTVFFFVISLGSFVINSLVRSTIESNIENEMKHSTAAILNMVRTSASVSIKNYFRAVAEKNRDIVMMLHQKQMRNDLSESEAKRLAATILISQKVGNSGYIYVGNSQGTALVHPQKEVQGVNFSQLEFVKKIMAFKEGYIEYDWKNPGEEKTRPKAIYITYFEPWDWIICVSAYREEFTELVNVNDFRESILANKFGNSGYSFVVSGKGDLIVHPSSLMGTNIQQSSNQNEREIARQMLTAKNGKLTYFWKNPEDVRPREKLVVFNYLPEYDWLVASSGYLDEIYAPLRKVQNRVLITGLVSLALVALLTFWLSSLITNPLRELMIRFSIGAMQDFSVRMTRYSKDEIGQLAWHFNRFMEKLEEFSINIKREVVERKQAEAALRLSEEMFSKAFLSSPNGIFITTVQEGRFININDSFVRFTGYEREEVIGKSLDDLKLLPDASEGLALIRLISQGHRLRNREISYLTKTGERRIGVFSADVIELWKEPAMLAVMEDITNRKQLEREVMQISERERQEFGQRLHDDLCPHLIGIEMLSTVHTARLEATGNPETKTAANIKALINEAIEKTRGMARGLCPVHLAELGVQDTIRELALNAAKLYNISCEFHCPSPVVIDDTVLITHLLYIAQEAIQNAVKHGKADKVTIVLNAVDKKLRLQIGDNGCGWPDHPGATGLGIRIMKFRVNMMRGNFQIAADQSRGTRLDITFPLPVPN